MPALNPGLRGPFAAPFRRAFAPGAQSIMARAIAVLRRFGQDAHIYLPGVGMLNGLQAGNYLDSAGTTQGTVDQPVGLVLDAAGGLGVELVTNGDFSGGATGWTPSNSALLSTVDQKLRVQHNGVNYPLAGFNLLTTAGKTYRLQFSVLRGTSASGVGFRALDGAFTGGGTQLADSGYKTSTGDYQVVFTAVSSASHIYAIVNTTVNAAFDDIDNISVREVTGIHSSQPTTSAKPILRRGAVNLLTYSGDFGNAAWSKTAVTVSGSQLTATNNNHSIPQAATVIASTAYTFVFYAKRGSMSGLKYSVYNNTGGAEIVSPTTYYAQTNDADYVAIVLQFTTPAGCTSVNVYPIRDSGATGTVFVQSAALFQGTYTAAQIQALGGIPLTTTAPASTALGPYWWGTTGGKTLVATFPAGNESVTVIDAKSTGQVTLTGQNVVGAYNVAEQLGPELVSNGRFDANASGWTPQVGGSITWNANGSADVVAVNYYAASTPLSGLTIGNTYKIFITSSATGRVYVSNSASSLAQTPYSSGGISGVTVGTFVATSATHYLHFSTVTGSGGANYDNISVREVIGPVSGKIIVNGALTAPELTLLQSYANKMAGL